MNAEVLHSCQLPVIHLSPGDVVGTACTYPLLELKRRSVGIVEVWAAQNVPYKKSIG